MRFFLLILCCLLVPGMVYAQKTVGQLRTELANAHTDSGRIEPYRQLISYYTLRNPDSSAWYSTEALKFFTERKNKYGEARILAELALLDENQGRWEIAKKRLRYVLALYTELNYTQGIADVSSDLGAIEGETGHYDLAIGYFLNSLKLHEHLNDDVTLMVTAMNLGSLYLQHDDSVKAGKYLFMAEALCKKIPLSDKVISLYNLIGIYYATTGNLDMALTYFNNDLKLSDKPQFVQSHMESLLYLGNFYRDLGQFDKSLQYLYEGLALTESKKMPEMQSNILYEIALAIKDKEPAKAMAYLEQTRDIAREIDNKSFLVNVYREMAALAEQQGKFKEALNLTRQKQQLADSVFNINKAREIASLAATYELEQSEVRVRALETLSNKNAMQRNIIFFIASGIIIVLIVLTIYYRKTVALNRKLKEHQAELSDLNKMKDKFFSIIGHDLRGPIASVPTILDVYEDGDTTEEEKKFLLTSLREHMKASTEMLDKLLFWGQSLMKGILIKEQYVYIKEFIKENIELKKTAANEKQIEIIDNTPEGQRVFADPTHCDFIVRNLLTNAIKYTYEKGKIEISSDTKIKPGYIIFAVKDNGIGIDRALLPHIFNPSYSVTGTANEKGTGIGLMLCKEFVQQNGGDIWVQSEPGEGATFFFSLKSAA